MLLLVLCIVPITAAAAETAGMTISQPGHYALPYDLSNPDNGILINSSDVILDGMGHSVEGISTDGSNGIHVMGGTDAQVHNITIRNISLRYWDRGIAVESATDFTIENVLSEWNTDGIILWGYDLDRGIVRTSTFRNNLWYGISIFYCSGMTVQLCSVDSNRVGVDVDLAGREIDGHAPVLLTDNEVHNNRENGIYFSESRGSVKNSTIRENGGDGIEVNRCSPLIDGNRIENNVWSGINCGYGASSTIINNWITGNSWGVNIGDHEVCSHGNVWNNMLNNTDNGYFGVDECTFSTLNTTKTLAGNIVGGPYLGGNFWAYPNGTGYSQTCTDADRDGICDAPYTTDGGNIDHLPLAPVPTKPVLQVPGGAGVPGDLDQDQKYDDVNGNGRADFADVVLYFNQMSWIAENEPVSAFDYNDNGRIDFADVVWLFNGL